VVRFRRGGTADTDRQDDRDDETKRSETMNPINHPMAETT
jgi:hypothetical protein